MFALHNYYLMQKNTNLSLIAIMPLGFGPVSQANTLPLWLTLQCFCATVWKELEDKGMLCVEQEVPAMFIILL
jgi:hypothetical protein